MYKKLAFGLIFALLVFVVVSCSSGTSSSSSTETGTCSGYIYAANGTTPIGGATVSIDETVTSRFNAMDVGFLTLSDTTGSDGAFSIEEVPVGDRVIYVQKGSWLMTLEAEVSDGETTDLGSVEMSATAEGVTFTPPDIAVIAGAYDTIEDIITSLGYSYDSITASDLGNSTLIATYEIIFINCGASNISSLTSTDAEVTNLKDFVEDGSSLYTSDWAYWPSELAWPNYIDFYDDDTVNGDAMVGNAQTITAEVSDATLQTVLGTTSVDITYDLGGWVVIDGVSADATTLLQSDGTISISPGLVTTDEALAVSFQPTAGSGLVIYTTFHNESQITSDMENILVHYITSL